MKTLVKASLSAAFQGLCIAGCSIQLIFTFISYFKYNTTTAVGFITPHSTANPVLSICYTLHEPIMNFSYISHKYKLKNLTVDDVINLLDNITIADRFHMSPKAENLLTSCKYRDDSGRHVIIQSNSTICNEHFKYIKYVFQQYVCYGIKSSFKESYNFTAIHGSLRFDRMMYEISIQEPLAAASKILPIVSGTGLPYIGKRYSPSHYKKSSDSLSFHISCQNIRYSKLGMPFAETKCASYKDYFYCIQNCTIRKLKQLLDRYPYNVFYTGPSDNLIAGNRYISNITIAHELNEIDGDCRKSCFIVSACKYEHCITHSSTEQIKGKIKSNRQQTTFRVESPPGPETVITFNPAITILDTIVYALSSLGSWFGLIIIKCNPVKLFDNYRDRTKVVVIDQRPKVRIHRVYITQCQIIR